ncbi:biopolymer transporter ExbD [Qipengyuania sp. 1XM1-15A]|uniref:ExbD/TolR family protein n=1 Tax=Qipengyuania xiamenensis TaxID=2867237 RepID=UPI001C88496B|nr:biopolymer transporter ExbD [Qipengyuania xiamenensis]MBX7533851.1 biopolymer transporter ExbD [Qipengyuania xiamenensis]
MAFTARRVPLQNQPMSEMNVTPFIDVLLVLLIMFIMVIPIATHALLIPLPNGEGPEEILPENVVHIDSADRLFWNGAELSRQEMLNQLASTAALDKQPVVKFEPDALASYQASARTIALIKDSGVKNFAFVGNHKYRQFGRTGE